MAGNPSGNAPGGRPQRRIAWAELFGWAFIVAMTGFFVWLVDVMGRAGLYRD